MKQLEQVPSSRYLAPDEILALAKRDKSFRRNNEPFTKDDADYVKKNVLGAQVAGVNILTASIEHESLIVPPVARDFIFSPHTKVVMPEYFYPELRRWLYTPSTRRIQKIGKWSKAYQRRVSLAKKLADVIGKSEKTVAVADIANKPSYILFREMWLTLPWFVPAVTFMPDAVVNDPFVNFLIFESAVCLTTLIPNSLNAYFFEKGRGIFDKKRVHWYESITPHFESARRLFLAKGTQQILEEYPSAPGEDAQIVHPFPIAHARRFLKHLVEPTPVADAIMDPVFRCMGPTLDYTVRQWEPKHMLNTALKSDRQPARKRRSIDWMMVSERPLK